MHKATRNQKQLELMWEEKSANHPWLNGLKKANTNVVKCLVNMAFDLYNDCLCETISAHSWPARPLTTLAATRLISLMEDEGPDAVLPEFKPANAELHYRDPMCYRDMLSSVQAIELQKVKKMFLECIVYSIQIDGSVSKHMRDHKFVNVSVNDSTMSMTNGDRRTVFMVMHSPEERGAHGLLETVNQASKVCEANEDKLVGITTDGEAANTGRNAGLWKLLGDQLERNIFTFWCCAHRSDLATEAIINSVPELKIWKSSLIGVATYFRTSTSKKKMLEKAAIEMKQFPRHHDVRFDQHFLSLIDAVLTNIKGCKQVWGEITRNGDRKDKREASGYLNTWNERQIWLTALMGDIFEVFTSLEKQMQRYDILLPDIFTCSSMAHRKLDLLSGTPRKA
eukprot:gene7132-biopygen8533